MYTKDQNTGPMLEGITVFYTQRKPKSQLTSVLRQATHTIANLLAETEEQNRMAHLCHDLTKASDALLVVYHDPSTAIEEKTELVKHFFKILNIANNFVDLVQKGQDVVSP